MRRFLLAAAMVAGLAAVAAPAEAQMCSAVLARHATGNDQAIINYAAKVWDQLDMARAASGKRPIGPPYLGWEAWVDNWIQECSGPSDKSFYSVLSMEYAGAAFASGAQGN